MHDNIAAHYLRNNLGWFNEPGAYVLVDGQFGSTGKGALAVVLAMAGADRITVVTTNAGPNSGHVGFNPLKTGGHKKIKTQQVPVSVPVIKSMGYQPTCYLNGGAVIDREILASEIDEHRLNRMQMVVHPSAAVIQPVDREAELSGTIAAVASTGKGVGAAIARKVRRENNVAKRLVDRTEVQIKVVDWDWTQDIVFVETAQGYSLGLNEHRFHPFTTSRECTVGQALADARIPPQMLQQVVMSVRTFPIRVGNTDRGVSGDCYEDQREMTWNEIGVPAEMTTVTGRVRRVFSWSRIQFREAVAANRPDVIFCNFLNYLRQDEIVPFLQQLDTDYMAVMGSPPRGVLLGFGPYPEDVKILHPL